MKKLFGSFGRNCGTLAAALVVACLASAAQAQTAEEIIEKSIKAQGGREAFEGLKNVKRKGDVALDGQFGQMEGIVEEVVIPFKKARRSLDLAVFVQDEGYDGETAWRDGMMGLQKLEGQEANQIKQSTELNPLLSLKKNEAQAEKQPDETVDGVDYYVLKITAKERPDVSIFIDKKDDLVKRAKLKQNNPQFGEVEITADTTDYKEYGNIKLPTKNTVVIGDLFTIKTTYTDTEIDGEVDEKIFAMPEEAPAGDAKGDAKEEAKSDAK
jgi:hypothetical protein